MSDLTRSSDRVTSTLKELKDGSVVTEKGCKIYIPSRFRDKDLAVLGNEVYILGIFMLVVDDKYYAISNVNAMLRIDPSSINNVVLENKDHIEFVFEPGETVFSNTDPVINNVLIYYIFDEIVAKGNVPVYMDYVDLGRLFDSSKHHAGTKLASTPTILHMLLSVIGRNRDDYNQYFRQISNGKDLRDVTYIPLRSTTHGANNTTARLLGAHFADNLTSALVDPSNREENIERILRM